MAPFPRDRLPDSSIAFLRDPYRFISQGCARHESVAFETRLLFRKTICMTGADAARMFYDPQRTLRAGAAPERLQKSLFGHGGVQTLDGADHEHRKGLFLSLAAPERVRRLGKVMAEHWRAHAAGWTGKDEVVLYDALQEPLMRAVCEWAGVPLPEPEVAKRTRETTALFDAAGSIGWRHWYSRFARNRANRWMEGIVDDVRAGRLKPAESSALHDIATHRDRNGESLESRTAAVEVMNVIRPTVAVSVYIVFCAHALHEYPQCRGPVLGGEDDCIDHFIDEVRRYYPFFPAVVALVANEFEWNGYTFPKGRRLLLDLYGTNHDTDFWADPERFRPDRFREQKISPYNFIPQGGGDHLLNHRCPGESIARELMKTAVHLLTQEMAYDVPRQDLAINFGRLPALPYSRFVIRKVRVND